MKDHKIGVDIVSIRSSTLRYAPLHSPPTTADPVAAIMGVHFGECILLLERELGEIDRRGDLANVARAALADGVAGRSAPNTRG